jgi:hypothetical protein
VVYLPVTFDDSANIRDYLLDVNDINRPKVVDMKDIKPNKYNSAITMISRLIMLRKGTYPDFPEMGVDIVGRYRFAFEDECSLLSMDIEEQANRYLPEFYPISVYCNLIQDNEKHKIHIHIIINEIEYLLIYNISDNTLEGLLEG